MTLSKVTPCPWAWAVFDPPTSLSATALSHEDTDDLDPKPKPTVLSARHLKFDGGVALQPDETAISVDRIRALLRSGFTAVRVGNQTIASFNQQPPAPSPSPTPRPSTIPSTPPPSNSSSEETSAEESEEDTTTGTSPRPSTVPRTSGHPSTTPEPALVTESEGEEDFEETTSTPKSQKKPTKVTTPEPDVDDEAEETQQLQFLQAQYKRIKSAISKNRIPPSSPSSKRPLVSVRNNSEDLSEPPETPIVVTTTPEETTGTPLNLLAQLFRGFGNLPTSGTPPPSPFGLRSTSTPDLETTTAPEPESEATIPFIEPITTTTEAPMPPPEPDYLLASKQLSPFVSGVRSLDSGSTRDALDTASQMGKLTWLVNYYVENQQQAQPPIRQLP